MLNYSPDDYRTSQSFLRLFLLMYIAVAMFYARQQAPRLTHYVDGTLVFGAPLAAMGLQYGLVRDIPFGMAYSALALGALYLVLAIFVKRRMGQHCRLLGEAFMALGVASATLAIPYGIDDRWMSAAWVLEAAGVIWTGLRQRRTLAWCFGLLVQLASWLSFLRALSRMDEATIAESHMAIGFVMLAIATFLIALQLRAADADSLKPFSADTGKGLAELLLPIPAAWLLAGAWLEVIVQTDGYAELNLMVGGAIGVAAALYGVCLRWQWRSAGSATCAIIFTAMIEPMSEPMSGAGPTIPPRHGRHRTRFHRSPAPLFTTSPRTANASAPAACRCRPPNWRSGWCVRTARKPPPCRCRRRPSCSCHGHRPPCYSWPPAMAPTRWPLATPGQSAWNMTWAISRPAIQTRNCAPCRKRKRARRGRRCGQGRAAPSAQPPAGRRGPPQSLRPAAWPVTGSPRIRRRVPARREPQARPEALARLARLSPPPMPPPPPWPGAAPALRWHTGQAIHFSDHALLWGVLLASVAGLAYLTVRLLKPPPANGS